MVLPSLSNASWDCTGSNNGRKCENSYALEAWFAKPFAISFLVEISNISTESGPNTTCFVGLVCVIWYIDKKFEAKEGTHSTFFNTSCFNLIEPFPSAQISVLSPMWILWPSICFNEENDSLDATIWLEVLDSMRKECDFEQLSFSAWHLSSWSSVFSL